jgi:hypothetical protein
VYTASTVLIAAHMFPSILAEISTAELSDGLERGYRILQYYETRTRAARRCRLALEFVHRKVISANDATQAQTAQRSQRPADNLEALFTSIETGTTGNSSSDLLPWDQDLSWLETALFDWDAAPV